MLTVVTMPAMAAARKTDRDAAHLTIIGLSLWMTAFLSIFQLQPVYPILGLWNSAFKR
jgi:hypothetical protein